MAAKSSALKNLSTQSFSSYVDVNGLSAGTHNVPIHTTTMVSDVQIVSTDPSFLMITIEPSAEKEVPVIARISGDAAANMIAGDITFSPDKIRVTGPKSLISQVSEATAQIVLSGEAEDFSKVVKLKVLDSAGKEMEYLTFSPSTVSATIKIVKAGNVKNVGIKVVTTGSPASGYFVSSISTNPSTVTIIGTADGIRALSSISTQPIDLSGAAKTITQTAKLDLPVGVKIDSGISSVSVTINLSTSQISRTFSIPVRTKNLPAGLKLSSISPQTVDVVISGSQDVISALTSDSINLTVDLSSFVAGNNSANLSNSNFVLPTGVSLTSFSPQAVTIALQ
ncbi:MAG: CdaR family protein [Caldisericia bacterium]|nr:CdaR family protein [Caldisericia bacterium]